METINDISRPKIEIEWLEAIFKELQKTNEMIKGFLTPPSAYPLPYKIDMTTDPEPKPEPIKPQLIRRKRHEKR